MVGNWSASENQRGRSILLAAALLAAATLASLAFVPSAHADARVFGTCVAKLTATPGQPTAKFTIACQNGVQGLQFNTTEGALASPVSPSSGNPTHGFPCLPSGSPGSNQITCQSGPPPLGGPGLADNETGTITLLAPSGGGPCQSGLAIQNLIVDTGSQGQESTPPTPPQSNASLKFLPVQCGGTSGANANNGGTGNNSTNTCDNGSGTQTSTQTSNDNNADQSRTQNQDCPTGNGNSPSGGVAAGFGGTALKAAAGRGDSHHLPLMIVGSGLLLLGLLGGGLALARRP